MDGHPGRRGLGKRPEELRASLYVDAEAPCGYSKAVGGLELPVELSLHDEPRSRSVLIHDWCHAIHANQAQHHAGHAPFFFELSPKFLLFRGAV